MRAAERQAEEEDVEAAGLWVVARHTVCIGCDRYRLTDEHRVCRPCATADLRVFAGTFEEAA